MRCERDFKHALIWKKNKDTGKQGKETLTTSQFVEHCYDVPHYDSILSALRAHADTFGIMYSVGTGTYRVVGFRFGATCRVAVPVFEGGKVVKQRYVTSTKHLNIAAKSFDLCVYKLFARAVVGDLYGYYYHKQVERLYWDGIIGEFRTEVVELKTLRKT